MCLNRVLLGPEITRMPAAMPFWADLAQGNDNSDWDNGEGTQRFGQWLRRGRRNRAHKCAICQHLSPVQSVMLGTFASIFECVFLLFSTLGALASILQPKMKNALLLLLLPLVAILPGTMARSMPAAEAAQTSGEMSD
uniref:Uncharacterized protein n=1 Tax=Globodera rostochiensis TaxID=31243 RepID=A0A914I8I6_GLORO